MTSDRLCVWWQFTFHHHRVERCVECQHYLVIASLAGGERKLKWDIQRCEREREVLSSTQRNIFFQLTNNISRSYLHFSSTDVPVIATDRERWGNTHRALARWWEKNVVCCLLAWGVYVVCLLHLLGLLRALFSLLSSTHDRAVIVISQKS